MTVDQITHPADPVLDDPTYAAARALGRGPFRMTEETEA